MVSIHAPLHLISQEVIAALPPSKLSVVTYDTPIYIYPCIQEIIIDISIQSSIIYAVADVEGEGASPTFFFGQKLTFF